MAGTDALKPRSTASKISTSTPPKRAVLKATLGLPPELRAVLDPIIERLEVLDGSRGEGVDRAVTIRDLTGKDAIDEAVIVVNNVINRSVPVFLGGGTLDPIADQPAGNTQLPPTTIHPPEPLTATAPYNIQSVATVWFGVEITWEVNTGNLSFVEVWRNSIDDLGSAQLLANVPPYADGKYVDYIGQNNSNYYWVRSVSVHGISTEFLPRVSGHLAATSTVNADVLLNLADAITVAEFATNSVTPVNLGTDAERTAITPGSGDYPNGSFFYTTDTLILYRAEAGAWVKAIDTASIVDDAIDITKFATSSVSPVNLGTDAERTAITPGSGDYPNGSFFYTTDTLILYRAEAGAWVKAVNTGSIQNSAITEVTIGTDAVTAPKIQANSIIASKMAIVSTHDQKTLNRDPGFTDEDAWSAHYLPSAEPRTYGNHGWVFSDGVTPAPIGDRMARLNSASRSDFYSEFFPVDPTKNYRVSCYAQQVSGTGGNYLLVDFRHADGTRQDANDPATWVTGWPGNGTFWYFHSGTAFTGSQVRYHMEFGPDYGGGLSMPPWANFAAIGCLGNFGAPDTIDVRIFDFRFEEIIPGELIVDGTITAAKILANTLTAGQIAAGAISTDELAANAVTASKIAVTGNDKTLNQDPVFSDPEAWFDDSATTTVSTWTFTTDSTTTTGNTIVELTSTGADNIYSRKSPIDVSKTYRVSLNLKRSAGALTTYLSVVFFDGAGGAISTVLTGWPNGTGTEKHWLVNHSGTTAWVNHQFTFGAGGTGTVPPTAKFAQLLMTTNYLSGGSTTTQFNDYKLEEVTPGELIVDGTITTGKLDTQAVTADKIFSNTITAGQIAAAAISATELAAKAVTASKVAVVGDQKTLNRDSHFTDEAAWSSASLYPQTFDDHSWVFGTTITGKVGDTYAQLNGGTRGEIYSDLLPIDSLKNYRVSCWARQPSGTGISYLLVAMKDGNKDHIEANTSGYVAGWAGTGTHWYFHNGVALASVWTQYSMEFGPAYGNSLPITARFAQVGVLGNFNGQAGTDVHVQGFLLEEIIPAELIVDGAITAEKLQADLILTTKLRTLTGTGNRVELEGDVQFPFWIGTSTKNAANGRFYYDQINDEIIVKGKLVTSTVEAAAGDPIYVVTSSDKKAQMVAMNSEAFSFGSIMTGSWSTNHTYQTLYGPAQGTDANRSFRLQATQQPFWLIWTSAMMGTAAWDVDWRSQYSYDGGTWTTFLGPLRVNNNGHLYTNWVYSQMYKAKPTGWSQTLRVRMQTIQNSGGLVYSGNTSANIMIPNFGLGGITAVQIG